jgi:hypothetical protein
MFFLTSIILEKKYPLCKFVPHYSKLGYPNRDKVALAREIIHNMLFLLIDFKIDRHQISRLLA